MKIAYISHAEVAAIYQDLLDNGYHEWYITLKIIDEMQIDYTFLSKLTWGQLLDNQVITNTTGKADKHYFIGDTLKKDIHHMFNVIKVDSYNEKIITTPVDPLYRYLLNTYEPIKNYKENGGVFRIDCFREWSIDINGVKTYAYKEVKSSDEELKTDEDIELTFLYIGIHAHKHDEKRPPEFRTKFWDKKIGITQELEKRMNDLSNDKRHGGTKSPLYVKALRAWVMPPELCVKVESELHDMLDERRNDGEWFEDFKEDLIKIVEKKVNSYIKKGYPIVKTEITEENQDISFCFKFKKEVLNKHKESKQPKRTYQYTL